MLYQYAKRAASSAFVISLLFAWMFWLTMMSAENSMADQSGSVSQQAEESHQEEKGTELEDKGTELIDAMRSASWIILGDPSAPVAYMFFDPASQESLEALNILAPSIKAGKFQIRLIMVALSSFDSFGMISGILQSNTPEAVLLSGSLSVSDIPYRRSADLPPHVVDGIRYNMDIAKAFSLPALPFISMQTDDGPAYVGGVPAAAQLDSALPPSFMPYYMNFSER